MIREEKYISILGSTGSIGTQTLDVLETTATNFRVNFLTVNSNYEVLAEQVKKFSPRGVAIADENACIRFKKISGFRGRILCGPEGIAEAAADEANDIVMSSLVGFSGVAPTLAAIRAKKNIALANKETLVSAGELIMRTAEQNSVNILAVDSEHSAILQCLVGESHDEIEKIILTASGGPFRQKSHAELEGVLPAQALKHPTWNMGSKITIDSATLMNKGFEMIEARWLFNLPEEKIGVVVHPQSIIHSFVQFVDGSMKAQLGIPDMRIPIAYALSFPRRIASGFERIDFTKLSSLTFEQPDYERFACLRLAYDALRTGGTATAVLNAANEIAVQKFLTGEIRFTEIPQLIENCLDKMPVRHHPSLEEIQSADSETRAYARSFTTSRPRVSVH